MELAWPPDGRELAFSSQHEAACSWFDSDVYAIGYTGAGYRRVTNSPACAVLAGLPIAALTGNLLLTLATFAGVYAAFRFSRGGFGAADGKVAVGLAAVLPVALLAGTVLQALAFGVLRLRGNSNARLPGVMGHFSGTVLVVLVLTARALL